MKIQLKRSNVLVENNARQPTAGQMEYGELAVNYNTTDPAIFIKDSNNNIIRIAGKYNIADDGQVELPATPTPPSDPKAGNLWYNNVDGRLYIYYTDEDTSQWVDASPDSWDPSSYPDVNNDTPQANTLDDRYLMLNSANDPVTGGLNITGGNVGIGTPSPQTLLEVLSPNTESETVASFGNAAIARGLEVITNGNTEWGFNARNTRNLVFNTQQVERMRINTDGEVGIGINDPNSLLHTSGSRNYTGTTPGAKSYDVNFVSGTAGVGIGRSNTIPAIQAYGGGTSYNLALNPNIGNVAIGHVAPTNLLHITDASAANDRAQLKLEAYRPAIRFQDLSDGQASAEICGDNSLQFRISTPVNNDTALTTRMMITNSGNVGINQTSPTARLDVRDGNFHLMPTGILPWESNSTTQNEGTYIGEQGRINLYQLDTTVESFYSASKINTTNGSRTSVFSVNTDGVITAPAGIRFSNDKEILDDYEEGTFTVRVTSSGNFGGSLASSTGYYTKIGRRVYISAKLLANNVQTAGHSGEIRIKGFPFAGGSNAIETIATPLAYNGAYGKYLITYDFPGSIDHILVCNSALSSDRTALFPNGANIRYYFSFSYTVY